MLDPWSLVLDLWSLILDPYWIICPITSIEILFQGGSLLIDPWSLLNYLLITSIEILVQGGSLLLDLLDTYAAVWPYLFIGLPFLFYQQFLLSVYLLIVRLSSLSVYPHYHFIILPKAWLSCASLPMSTVTPTSSMTSTRWPAQRFAKL